MGQCIYCGQDAGMLRKYHKECKEKHESGLAQIAEKAANGAIQATNLEALETQLNTISQASFIPPELRKKELIKAFERAVEMALEDEVITSDEEDALDAYKTHFKLEQSELNNYGAYTKLVQAGVLRDLMEGKIPQRIDVKGQLPFNLQKSEQLVWVFQNVKYYEERKRTTYIGGYKGVSIRIAKGVYYRTGGFRGNPTVTTTTVHIDTGLLGITTKYVYFAGGSKSFRVPYKKIVSFTPYSDGFGLQRDAMTAKPQSFVIGDGWFVYNLVSNLAQLVD